MKHVWLLFLIVGISSCLEKPAIPADVKPEIEQPVAAPPVNRTGIAAALLAEIQLYNLHEDSIKEHNHSQFPFGITEVYFMSEHDSCFVLIWNLIVIDDSDFEGGVQVGHQLVTSQSFEHPCNQGLFSTEFLHTDFPRSLFLEEDMLPPKSRARYRKFYIANKNELIEVKRGKW